MTGRPSPSSTPERYVDARELAALMGVSHDDGQAHGRRRDALRDLGDEPHPPVPALAGDGVGARTRYDGAARDGDRNAAGQRQPKE